jgi:uncharacterized protein (TIGR02594 family)
MNESGHGIKVNATDDNKCPPWIKIALAEVGVQEVPGRDHNKRILDYHATTTLAAKQDDVAWCSSFVNWCFKQSMIKGTGLANARSWLDWGYPMDSPTPGCIVVLTRLGDPKLGHVGFFWEMDYHTVTLLGGNQDNKVGFKKYAMCDVLGFRWPFKVVT